MGFRGDIYIAPKGPKGAKWVPRGYIAPNGLQGASGGTGGPSLDVPGLSPDDINSMTKNELTEMVKGTPTPIVSVQ